ncbi:hypothetical protein JW868_01380 [Candidatus Woesearchaeota archaeon]|nr:hypothetical protein [Candidatus Woesearchaeota archaeon]
MVTQSVLAGTLAFLDRIGIFDVVLPFVLTFTIVYAVLEKTKVFGTETIFKDNDFEKASQIMPRKNLNAMTAFVVAFFVVASARIVAIINQALAHVVVLLVLIVSFMMLMGTMYKGNEPFELPKAWKIIMGIVMALGIALIFLNAAGVLDVWWYYLLRNWDTNAVSAIGLLVLILIFMMFITKGSATASGEGSSGSSSS